jgi:isocitrate dehydrogenase kinase/phosphatase
LFKNFGVTRFGRIVFYDYDEIEYLTACHFRKIPPPPPGYDDMANDVWYPVASNDVFPEEFATFLLTDPDIRATFLESHSDLLDAAWWQAAQRELTGDEVPEVLSYPESLRFARGEATPAPDAPGRATVVEGRAAGN